MTVPTTDDGHADRRSLHERIAADLRDAVTVREHRQRTMRPAAYMAPAESGKP